MNYEQILTNMLDKLPDNYDKRQGSILYDILAALRFGTCSILSNFGSIFGFKLC